MDEESVTEKTKAERKPRKAKSGSIPREELDQLSDGIHTWDKKSFHMIGPKGGVLLAVPKSKGVSRAYFYAAGDYNLIPEHPAIKVYQPDERKERKLGGVMAELDFSQGLELAREGLGLLLESVRKNEALMSHDVGDAPAEPSAED